ncbi:hypothetical protein [Nocardioides sp. Arc9.136]|uniref:hypothetical protein n=1 Tax=Nocardioides sp. Arc9.136 TaxID=2996826 RepID=UPI002665148B|nr:hypothetical protein [Nocardioides sp. Arc9.136]WKN47117.1 hypothetical protein OSR43_13825 [Nocardioides sp. Arc9.136]
MTTDTRWAVPADAFLTGGPVVADDHDALVDLVDAGLFYCGRSFRHARHEVTKDGRDLWCSGRRFGDARPTPKHRATARVVHRSYPLDFQPRHCAGTSCLGHAHPGEPQLPVWGPAGQDVIP